jgi:hypothetical protein
VLIESGLQNVDPFTFTSMSLAQLYKETGYLAIEPFQGICNQLGGWQNQVDFLSYRPFGHLIITVLSIVTGMNVSTLSFLPVNALLFSLITLALAKRLFADKVAAFAYLLFVIANFPTLVLNMDYITLGVTFVFLYALLLTIGPLQSRRTVLLATLLFVTASYTYYQSEFMIVLLTLAAGVAYSLHVGPFRNGPRTGRPLFYLGLAFLLAVLGLDPTVYYYVNLLSVGGNGDFFAKYVQYVVSLFIGGSSGISGFHSEFAGNPIWTFILLGHAVNISIVGLPLGLLSLAAVRQVSRKFSRTRTEGRGLVGSIAEDLQPYSHVLFGLAGIGVCWALVYIPLGYFNYLSIYWYLSIPAVAIAASVHRSLRSGRRRMIVVRGIYFGVIVLLITSAFLGVFTFVADAQNPCNSRCYGSDSGSLQFVASRFDGASVASTDIHMRAQEFYDVFLAGNAGTVCVLPLEPSQLMSIDSWAGQIKRTEVLVLSRSMLTKRIDFDVWGKGIFPPSKDSFVPVVAYPGSNLIYDDGTALVFIIGVDQSSI